MNDRRRAEVAEVAFELGTSRRRGDAIAALRQQQAQGSGKSIGMNQLWGYIIGAVGLAAFLLDRFGR